MSETLYKYLSIERISYLENELLRFTQPGDLNDPFECIPVIPNKEEVISMFKIIAKEQMDSFLNKKMGKTEKNYLKLELEKKHKSIITAIKKDLPNNLREHFLKSGIEKINKNLGIFSLSRRWNSTLMWAHYTNSHKGFCIGYNRNSNFFKTKGNPNDPEFSLEIVNYSQNRVKVPVERGEKINDEVLLTKSLDWEYEKEERIITFLKLADKKIVNNPYFKFLCEHKNISDYIKKRKINNWNLDSEYINQFYIIFFDYII